MSWAHVSSRLGNIKSETRSIAKELYDVASANGHEIWFMWGMGSSVEHSSGLALDLMVRNKAAGDFIRNYIWNNRARLRTRHVIWWQRITSTVVQPGVVRLMADRGNSTQNHMDHIHVWFFAGTYQAPVTAPKPVTSIVKAIQYAVEVDSDGKWGPLTDARVMFMRTVARAKSGYPANIPTPFDVLIAQRVIDTKDDGIWGPNSQQALVDWIEVFQRVIGVGADGKWGPKTDARLLSLRRTHFGNY